jgi:hypothetical protein
MESSGMGIDDLLSNSAELFAITGLHRSDLHGEEDSDGSADEIEEYLKELELHEEEDMDFDPTIESPMRSSTPVRGTDADEDEPTTVTTTDDIDNEQEPIPHDMPTTWSDSFTPLIVEPFIPTTKGLVQGLQSPTTALDVFKMVFDVSLFDKITEETNRYAAQKQQIQPDPVWTPTNTAEIQAFVGIHITMGLVRYPRYHLYWSKDDYFTNRGIANTMTRRRFEALERYLHVNDLSKMPRKK